MEKSCFFGRTLLYWANFTVTFDVFQVQRTLFKSPNLKISCSESGKMGKKHLEEYIKDVYIPGVGPESCLVVDSWSTFTEENIRASIPEGKQVRSL